MEKGLLGFIEFWENCIPKINVQVKRFKSFKENYERPTNGRAGWLIGKLHLQ